VKGNSYDLSSVRFVGQVSRAYNTIGKHFVSTKCKTTFSGAALQTLKAKTRWKRDNNR